MRVFSRAAIAAAVVAMSAAIPFGLTQSQVAQAQQAPSGSADGGISIGPVDVDFGAGTGAIILSRTTDLGTGDAVTVTGTGFKANTPLYLAQTVAKPAVGFPTTYGQEAKVTTEADGSFTADIEVSRNVKNIDCLQNDCYIATFAAFPSIFTDRSQDVWVPISFASDAAVGQQGSGAAPGTGGPVTTVSKPSGINASGETLRVSGTGFSAAGAGIYVGLAETGRYNPANADSFASTVYVRSTEINGGAWTVDLPVQARTGETDCLARSCAVYTLAAHGSPDRSQDTIVPVTFDPAGARETPGTTPAAAAGTPSVSASKTSGLNAAGDTITVSGTGFATTGPGIYVGVAQSDRFSTTNASAFQDTRYIRAADMAGGSWSTTLNVAGAFGDSDCTRNACAVYTFAAHGSADRSQDTTIPISFVGTATPTTTTTAAPAGTAAVSASKTAGVDPAGETVTVSGTGFSGAGAGIYVGLIQDDRFSATDASAWMTTAYLTPDKIVDGAWSTEMELAAMKGDSDCIRNTCSIYTVAAHGTADRSQDTRTAVTFGTAGSTSSPATTSAAPTAHADPEVRTLADTKSAAEESGTSTETAVISVILVTIAAVVAGAFVLRRKD
ncbi:neocarzinostatin apoprotein domain-containing protein [Rhodococcus sp. Q]|uniref:neocarzinostatin apoprotein domain-containing protein n=1 Tax=Rhodococcus sp. Q TaxID=2502252 RepID=UPI0010F5B104|nr:neocarzinostatin apoprotein domain-containing protein [Rhodococcus sp. Q]